MMDERCPPLPRASVDYVFSNGPRTSADYALLLARLGEREVAGQLINAASRRLSAASTAALILDTNEYQEVWILLAQAQAILGDMDGWRNTLKAAIEAAAKPYDPANKIIGKDRYNVARIRFYTTIVQEQARIGDLPWARETIELMKKVDAGSAAKFLSSVEVCQIFVRGRG